MKHVNQVSPWIVISSFSCCSLQGWRSHWGGLGAGEEMPTFEMDEGDGIRYQDHQAGPGPGGEARVPDGGPKSRHPRNRSAENPGSAERLGRRSPTDPVNGRRIPGSGCQKAVEGVEVQTGLSGSKADHGLDDRARQVRADQRNREMGRTFPFHICSLLLILALVAHGRRLLEKQTQKTPGSDGRRGKRNSWA